MLFGVVGGIGSLRYSLSDETAAMIETLPEAAQKFRQTLRVERGTSESAIERVQKATTELEEAASDTPTPSITPPAGVPRVQIEKAKFNIQDYLWAGTMGAVGFAGQVVIVLFPTYFLIVSGDSFRRKLVRITIGSGRPIEIESEYTYRTRPQESRPARRWIALSQPIGQTNDRRLRAAR